MNFNDELNSRIVKNSENILLLFPSEYRYINRDVIFRLENKKLNNLGDDDREQMEM